MDLEFAKDFALDIKKTFISLKHCNLYKNSLSKHMADDSILMVGLGQANKLFSIMRFFLGLPCQLGFYVMDVIFIQ